MMKEQRWTRRRVLSDAASAGVVSAGGILSVGGPASAGKAARGLAPAAKAPPADTKGMPQRTLGRTGEKIPILVMGGSMNWDQGIDPRIPEAIRHGVTYFDSAYSYAGGNNERAIGRYLARFSDQRAKLWITSKSTRHEPEGYEALLSESLERLQTSYVNMYFLHGLQDPAFLSPAMRTTFERLKKQGKVRYFGFSCHNDNVTDLLQRAADLGWVDAVMFRYNFREYGDKKLNKAIDACVKAGVGLIAMKTQGSSVSFESRAQKYQQAGKWNKYQAVLKAVWEDERITAAVSEMATFDALSENVAAAKDKKKLGAREWNELHRYASATRNLACRGCESLCNAGAAAPVQIGTTLRYLMYHDSYGKPEDARRLYRELPPEARNFAAANLDAAAAACPQGIPIERLITRARDVLT